MKQHEGVWLPDGEDHFCDMMSPGAKRFQRDQFGRGCYQKHKLDAAMEYVTGFRRAIDIGTHVGLWSMHLEYLFDAVECFEPVSTFSDILPHNMRTDKWALHRVALGNEDGEVSIKVPRHQTGASHIDTGSNHPRPKYDATGDFDLHADIPLRTLDSFGFDDVDFIKIDVEGFERFVIEGAEQTIKAHRPVLVVEQKGNDVAFGDMPGAAVGVLKSWGARELRPAIAGDYIMGW